MTGTDDRPHRKNSVMCGDCAHDDADDDDDSGGNDDDDVRPLRCGCADALLRMKIEARYRQ